MSFEQVKPIVWLRWRLLANSMKRSGRLNTIVASTLIGAVGIGALLLFVIVWQVGLRVLEAAEPGEILWQVSAMTFAYFVSGLVGIAMFVQRTSPLSLGKLLHYPVAPSGAFFSNFVASLASLSNVLFAPVFLGYGVALVATRGFSSAWFFIGVLGLMLLVSACMNYAQEWLALRIENKRTQGLVMALFSILLVVGFLTPTVLVNQKARFESQTRGEKWEALGVLDKQHKDGFLTEEELEAAKKETGERFDATVEKAKADFALTWTNRLQVVSLALPFGWLAGGAFYETNGVVWSGWLAALGLFAMTGLVLQAGYAHAVGVYTGTSAAGGGGRTGQSSRGNKTMLSGRLPWVSDECAAVVFMTIRCLLRSPEAKTMLTVPFALIVSFGSALLVAGDKALRWFEGDLAPVAVLGIMTMGGFGVLVFVENQFNYEGGGFRNYLLNPVNRRRLLLAKNLAVLPVGLIFGTLGMGVGIWFLDIGFLSAVAVAAQFLTVLIVFLLIGNWVSIFHPMDLSASKLAQANTEFTSQFLVPVLTFPITFIPVYIPLLFAGLARWSGMEGDAIYLGMSLAMLGMMVWVYHWGIGKQAQQFHRRELQILDTVTAKSG